MKNIMQLCADTIKKPPEDFGGKMIMKRNIEGVDSPI